MRRCDRRPSLHGRKSKNSGGLFDVAARAARVSEMETRMAAPDFWNDPEEAKKLVKSFTEVKRPLDRFQSLEARAKDAREMIDLIEAESELVSGYSIEFSGSKFAMLFLAEYSEAVVLSTLTATLFLGGWRGPFLPPVLWLVIKIFAVFSLVVWIRSTMPRLRIDQAMAFTWKFLLPLALIHIIITSTQIVFWPGAPVWSLVLLNLAIVVALVLLWSRLYRLGGGRVEV